MQELGLGERTLVDCLPELRRWSVVNPCCYLYTIIVDSGAARLPAGSCVDIPVAG